VVRATPAVLSFRPIEIKGSEDNATYQNPNRHLPHRIALNLAAEYTEKTIRLFRVFRVFRGSVYMTLA